MALASPMYCVVHCIMLKVLLLCPAASTKRFSIPGVQRIMYSIGYAFRSSILLISRSTLRDLLETRLAFLACIAARGSAMAILCFGEHRASNLSAKVG